MLTKPKKCILNCRKNTSAEIAAKFKSPAKINLVETTTKVLQGLAIIVGIWATYSEFKKYNDEKKEQAAERDEADSRGFF